MTKNIFGQKFNHKGFGRPGVPLRTVLRVCMDDGFARINIFSCDTCYETGALVKQVETFKQLHGHYQELLQVD